jgi:hypothetical protein
VEAQAAYSPVALRIAPLCTCEHDVKDKEGQKNTEHADKLEQGGCGNVAVFLLLCRLNQRGKHYADAKEVTDVGEVNVEIPADHADVVKDAKASYKADKAKRAINGLENELGCSVLNHG